jgi:general secretion pathway protein J
MTRAVRQSANAGFTLVEALVATLLMSIILAALATVTAQWLPNWNRGMTRLQRVSLLAAGLDRLAGDIAAAEFISAGAGKGPLIFDGGALSVSFVRTVLSPNAGPGLEVVRIAEVGGEGGPDLVRSTAPLPVGSLATGSGDTLPFANPVVVIRAPYRVSFSYAGVDRVWRESWRGQIELPRAVRIQVRDNGTSRLLAASTSALVHVELPASCTFASPGSNCPGGASGGR